MKTLKKKIVAGALAFTLVGGAVIANPQKAEAAGKPLNIKKVLNLPAEGVETPYDTFGFKFTPVSFNGDTNVTTDEKKTTGEIYVPLISAGVNYEPTDNIDNDTSTPGKQVIRETEDALKNANWKNAGQYVYKVTEYSPYQDEDDMKDMTYSKAEYTVSIFVKELEDGTFEVYDIQIKKDKKDDGTVVEDANKQEYTPGQGDDKKGNEFVFENNWDKKDGNDNPSGGPKIQDADKKGFALRKTIAGENPSTTDRFTFSLNVAKPEGSHSDATSYSYYIVDSKGEKSEKLTGEYGKNTEVKLKHNERVVFAEVLLGSKVTAKETKSGTYIGKVKSSSFNGTAGEASEGIIGDQGGNFVEFENKEQTPTGLLVDNLPFIALIAVAGLGIFFFVKNRKEEEALA